jgi:DNA repair exonuclease SbcCD ATPase subunit
LRLKKLKLRNFLSYAKLDFDFANTADESPSIYIISGINKDSNSSDEEDNSNGSGKSTLVGESISFNLFGRNLRGSQKKIKLENAIKFGEGTMLNDAEYFIDNNTVLKIRREK